MSLDYPNITIEDAHAAQREWVNIKIAEGRTLSVGQNRPRPQKRCAGQLTVNQRTGITARCLDDMFFHDGGDIPPTVLSSRVLKWSWRSCRWSETLRGPHRTLFDVYNATGLCGLPALTDTPQHRPGKTQRPAQSAKFDTISDNAANASASGGRPIKLQTSWICVLIPRALLYRNVATKKNGRRRRRVESSGQRWRSWRTSLPRRCPA